MKSIIAFTICMLAFSGVFAQNKGTGKKKENLPNINVLPQKNSKFHKSAIGGYFTDMRRRPVKGVKAFIYLPDSSIAASGYTDSAGYYETNAILPGQYDIKFVYPSSQASVRINGIPVKAATITDISMLKSVAPTTDTVINYFAIAPLPPVDKKKPVKK